ncbi:MAG: flippase-like domain-containing protein [Myxococcales bacterium]|nr:flippase-like domain-containing protein [Myxococcales bacterium]
MWRRALPFLLAIGLLGWVLHRTGWQQLRGALSQTNLVVFFAFSWAMQVLSLLADSYATTYVYRKTVCPIRFREMVVIRGASYLPSMLNHNLGQAWLTYFIARRYTAPLWRVAGATLLVYGTNLAGLLLLCALALPFNGARVPWLAPVVGLACLGGLGYFALLKWGARLLSRWQATAPLVEIGVSGHLKAIAVRIPHVATLYLSTWLVFSFFGVWIPPGAALAYVPVLMVVAALPLTPGAIGTRDAVAVELLAAFATGEHGVSAIAATTLSWFVMLNLGAALLSPPLMRRASTLLESREELRPD